jgi:hypothetical protein
MILNPFTVVIPYSGLILGSGMVPRVAARPSTAPVTPAHRSTAPVAPTTHLDPLGIRNGRSEVASPSGKN